MLNARPLKSIQGRSRIQAVDNAPFVLPSYDRTVMEKGRTAISEDCEEQDVPCFLASFTLPLADDAAAGRWPLTLTASGQTQPGAAFAESLLST